MKVEKVSIDSIKEDDQNARTHGERNIQAIQKSLESFGQLQPLVVWNETVIAGNGRLQAAVIMGWDTIDIVRLPSDWTEEKARAFALADNRTSDLATWNLDEFVDTLHELQKNEMLDSAGWTPLELKDLEGSWNKKTKDLPMYGDEKTVKMQAGAKELIEKYMTRDKRSLVIDLPLPLYSWLLDKIALLKEYEGLQSNTEVLGTLIAEYLGEEVPDWITQSLNGRGY